MPSWSRPFDDPIALPRGHVLVTLEDAANFILKLPKKKRDLAQWQLAGRILIAAAEGRDFPMHARIAMMKAISANDKKAPPPGMGKRGLK